MISKERLAISFEALNDICSKELGDYCFLDRYKIEHDHSISTVDYYYITFPEEARGAQTIYAKVRHDGGGDFTVFVEVGEEHWYEVRLREYSIKYFWQAALWQA